MPRCECYSLNIQCHRLPAPARADACDSQRATKRLPTHALQSTIKQHAANPRQPVASPELQRRETWSVRQRTREPNGIVGAEGSAVYTPLGPATPAAKRA